MRTGLIFNIQKYSVRDGPGIRTTVFFKGCPLRCAWCHNPESLYPGRELILLPGRCIQCGECRRACPRGAERESGEALPDGNDECLACGACTAACPTEARQWAGRSMTVPEVLETILEDRVFYQESGGGATFSGGEPLAQVEFLRETLAACRDAGVHTAVDTSGFCRPEDLLSVAPLADLFLYDLKLMDDAGHLEWTGAHNQRILSNLRLLGRIHKNIWVRVPLIPGVNDTRSNLKASAAFAAEIPGVRQVSLLPYHGTGLEKWRRLARIKGEAQLPGADRALKAPSARAVEGARRVFARAGLVARTGN